VVIVVVIFDVCVVEGDVGGNYGVVNVGVGVWCCCSV